jgi:ribose 5-phosphate isomerase B
MKIAIGADHAGFHLKEALRRKLIESGHQVVDVGTHSTDSTDYPDFAAAVARQVARGDADRGILVCSSGVGMSIAANKIRGIRAALGVNAEEVTLTRSHNDINVLALGAKFTDPVTAAHLVDIFLQTPFDGGRHERRLKKVADLESQEDTRP